jgi:alpha-tubulin suppressor-like RCC1 family protein
LEEIADGTITVTASQTSLAGLLTETSITLTKDTQAPASATSLAWQQSSPTNSTALTASWSSSTASDLSSQKIQFYSDGSCSIASGALIDLNNSATQQAFTGANGGTYAYKITSIDTAGNLSESSCSAAIAIDTTPPTITFAAPTALNLVNSLTDLSAYPVSGACETGGTLLVRAVSGSVTVSASPQPSCSSGTFSTTLNLTTLGDGTVTFTAIQTDLASNQGQTSVNVTKDTQAPASATALAWQQSSPTNSTALTATWSKSTASDLSSQKIQFYSDASCSVASGSLISLTSTATEQAFTGANGGTYAYQVTSIDTAGNSSLSTCSSAISVNVAAAAPLLGKISAGTEHTCEITPSGILKCWGRNQHNQLGNGSSLSMAFPTVIDAGSSYTQISAGGITDFISHTCGITEAGTLKCWGANTQRQLGDGTTTYRSTPTIIDSGISYIKISAGQFHSCGITTSGTLKCWGQNAQRQLGDGSTTNRSTPTIIDSGITFSTIAAGALHSCGITTSGTLKCWGDNTNGQLGDGTTTYRSTPTIIDPGTTYITVTAGGQHSCGVTTAGTLKCWGDNTNGQLGDGSIINRSSPTVIHSGTTYASVEADEFHTCGVTTMGSLNCWGLNTYSRLGDGTSITRKSPTLIDSGTTYSAVATGRYHTCGVTTWGMRKCWGLNTNSPLGDGTIADKTTPRVMESNRLSAGEDHSCGITETNTLKCWGFNSYGYLGDGTSTDQLSPKVIDAGVAFARIATSPTLFGIYHSCGITDSGVLKCWGNGSDGQLGTGTSTSSLTPAVVPGGFAYSAVATGAYHTCGIRRTGSALTCWGYNISGQLGDGTQTSRSLPTVIDSGTAYASVTTHMHHTCGITTSGVLKCWGENASHQLGDGTMTGRSLPTVIDTGTAYATVATGPDYTCGITSSGALKCWGTENGITLPVPEIIDAGTPYASISLGYRHRCGITTSGVLKCWGENSSGQLGIGSFEPQTSPMVVDAGTIYTRVTAGNDHTCGTTQSGTLKCWGRNESGQLGDATTLYKLSPTLIGGW